MEARRYPKNPTKAFEFFWACGKNEQSQVSTYRLALNGYVHGMRSRGRPKKRWIDTIREDCDEMKVDLHIYISTCTYRYSHGA